MTAKLRAAVASLALLASGGSFRAAAATAPEQIIYVGTQSGGPGKGIFAARFDPRSGRLGLIGPVADIDRPTWQVGLPGRPILFSVSETGDSDASQAGVYSLSVDRRSGRLTILSRVESGGVGATHLMFDPRSSTLFVANYGTGSVAAVPVMSDGRLGPLASRQQDVGAGPSRRQAGPHAHFVGLDPTGRYLLAADLGADRIFLYRFDPATRALTPGSQAFATPPGSGPRHVAFAPNGRTLYFDSELSGEVTACTWDRAKGELRAIQTLPLAPAGYTGPLSAAEISASADGRFLYVSTRGNDSLLVYAIDPVSGKLTELQRIPAGGKTPWSFTLSPAGDWMLVANQGSGLVAEFKVDRQTGKLTATDQTLALPVPVKVTFAP